LFVQQIHLQNFRNIADCRLSILPEGALISGRNGIGKTNLLEGIAYTAFGKSIRGASDANLICFDNPFFHIHGVYEFAHKPLHISITVDQAHKSIKIDKVPVSKLSELYQYLKVVYFSPDDIHVVAGSPRLRRQFFDTAIAQHDYRYIDVLRTYMHILQQRNALLKTTPDLAVKKAWDDKFVEAGIAVVEMRQKYLSEFEPRFRLLYSQISGDRELPSLVYEMAGGDVQQERLLSHYEKLLKIKNSRELLCQRSLFGPHLDDVNFLLENKPARFFASQGQKRSLAIAMRFAQAKMVVEHEADYPILMFDDVLSELDAQRTKAIIKLLSKQYQVLIATPNPDLYHDYELPVIDMEKIQNNQNSGAL
jgi:DNA replication and repair protein RecF